MKRSTLLQHLRKHGCVWKREGGSHSRPRYFGSGLTCGTLRIGMPGERAMTRRAVQILAAVGFVVIGWGIGRAQTTEPNFEIVAEMRAEPGSLKGSVQCVRGCSLSWVERGINPNAQPMRTFEFSCTAAEARACSSARVGGWITPR
jgi:hypothetical protein